jgi:hypothetical protein
VDTPGGAPPRRPPAGAVLAAAVLVAVLAALVAAILGLPPFTASLPPSPSPSAPPATVSPAPSRSPGPSPTASQAQTPLSAAEIRARIAAVERQVAEIRGLAPAGPVEPLLISTAEAGRLLTEGFRSENPPELLADQTLLYRALGLLDAGEELGALYERFLATQVLGFYRPTDQRLYIVSDRPFGPLEELTAAHEYTHALQDGSFDFDKVRPADLHDQGDLALARTALVEGDATLAMYQWAFAELSPDEISQLAEALQDPVAEEALAEAPPILRETQSFPYVEGLTFAQRTWLTGGWDAVDRLWQRPPDTTEQILHPEKYDAREGSIAVSLPAGIADGLGVGWTLVLEDTHGELITRTWFAMNNAPDKAAIAAAGWGGDRIGLYRGPGGAWAVLWLTRWDEDPLVANVEYVQAYGAAQFTVGMFPHALARRSGEDLAVAIAPDAPTLRQLASLLP